MIVPTNKAVEMFDASATPPPPHDKLLCGNSKLGVTTIDKFRPGWHDCWYFMPVFPKSLKEKKQ